MAKYILQRFAGIIITLFLLSLVIFILSRSIPGGPWMQNAEVPLSEAQVAIIKARYGLDRPILEQYGLWVWNALRLDFGNPFSAPEMTVRHLIARYFPICLKIGVFGAVIAIGFGVLVGMLCAGYKNRWLDNALTSGSVIIGTVPSYIMAIILISVVMTAGVRFEDIFNRQDLQGYFLPALAMGLTGMGRVALWTRQCMLEAIESDYVRTAYAKGLATRQVFLRHVFRNALIPMVTTFLPLFPLMIISAFLVEFIFQMPGLGSWYIRAIYSRDYPLVLSVTMVWAVMITFTYFLVDILYGLIDPRVRVGGEITQG